MRKVLIAITLLLFSTRSFAQDYPCEYIPLEFEEVEPMWSHLIIDSTFIGYIDSSGKYVNEYIDGMDHLSFDFHSFVDDAFLYSITNVEYDRDLAGYNIEKINIETGEKVWDIKTDLRHVENREKIIDVFVRNGELVMYGVRTFWDEKDLTPSSLLIGFVPGYFFERRYNIETGELTKFYTPDNNDSLALEMSSKSGTYYLIKVDENRYDYFFLNVNIFQGIFLERTIVDSLGHQVAEKDTVVEYSFNDVDLTQAFQVSGSKLMRIDDFYFFLELLIPKENSGLELQAIIYKYDLDFNLIKSSDLKTLGITEFSNILISEVINDVIIMRGCSNNNPMNFCDLFYFYLDKDLNLLETFDAQYKSENINYFGIRNQDLNLNNEFFAIDRTLMNEGNSYLNLYRSNVVGSMDSLFRFTIKEENWVAETEQFFILENDDVLAKITHSCYFDGSKWSWHPEWFRFKAEDINLLSSNSEVFRSENTLKLFPNPTDGTVYIVLEESIDGRLEIYDALGQKVLSHNINVGQKDLNIDMARFTSGYYFVKLFDKQGQVVDVQKLVRE